MLWKASEWETSSGWHCNCTDNLAGGSSLWYLPARILNISPADLIILMKDKYNAEVNFCGTKDNFIVLFTWEKQSDMRLWKNFINRKAREINFQI